MLLKGLRGLNVPLLPDDLMELYPTGPAAALLEVGGLLIKVCSLADT